MGGGALYLGFEHKGMNFGRNGSGTVIVVVFSAGEDRAEKNWERYVIPPLSSKMRATIISRSRYAFCLGNFRNQWRSIEIALLSQRNGNTCVFFLKIYDLSRWIRAAQVIRDQIVGLITLIEKKLLFSHIFIFELIYIWMCVLFRERSLDGRTFERGLPVQSIIIEMKL